ncbi:MAG: gamma-glutamyl-gamma-aminobutyrate hydrolase family protein [Sedimentibacter sp.]
MRPIIGITIDKNMNDGFYYQKVNECNLNAVSQNGGLPIMLPITNNEEIIDVYLSMIDGIYFTGGSDINPLLFGEDPIKTLGSVDYDRDEFEIKLYKKAAMMNMPMLGICRGQQVMNVAAGGSLYQDIYSQRIDTNGHSPKFSVGGYEYHTVEIMNDTKIGDIFKAEKINTNSFHHQAVKEVAEDYIATAFTQDGIIEGIESTKLSFAVGLQWHPEIMYERYPIFSNVFKALTDAAKVYSISK